MAMRPPKELLHVAGGAAGLEPDKKG